MNLNWTVASCPARIDLFGGWTDTPPICYSIEGAVVNAAITINEKHPITAKGRRIPQKVIKLIEEDSQNPAQFIRSLKDLENYRDPSLPGALFKACLIGSGFVNPSGPLLELQLQSTGIEIRTCSELPHGSGLGTSSILASCIIAVLWKLKNSKITIENEKLFHTVLKTEELLTTGGGWQDQVGGVVGGVKIGRCSNGSSFRITYEKIDSNISLLNENLKLIYTGKTRLAKNLLETVLQNWQNGEPEVTSALEELRLGSVECVRALQTGS
ncbi:hypothetical protein QYM36_001753 [Artemia franciscana]|uniref:GHMP kinase N-terminal domain-containing protein n=1 Tax=Artemia franciscana TaxID=6661 RepID=A0AA88I7B9_ARTSF|nr:hypothetical protein QYM36_001753 [Artemia franciscana]